MCSVASTGILQNHALIMQYYFDNANIICGQAQLERLHENQRVLELLSHCFNQKRHRRFYVISIDQYRIPPKAFFQLPPILQSTHISISVSQSERFIDVIALFSTLLEWLHYQDDSKQERTGDKQSDRRHRYTERTMFFLRNHLTADLLFRATSVALFKSTREALRF